MTSQPANALSFKAATGGTVTLRQHCFQDRQEAVPAADPAGGPATRHVELRRQPNCR